MRWFKKTPEDPWKNLKFSLFFASMLLISLVVPQVFGFLMRWLFK